MEILEAALPAQFPSSPQKTKIMAAALLLGLVAGGGIAVLRDLMDQTLRSGEEISGLLGLPVLGVVPAMSRRQKIPTRGQRVHLQPDSPEAEAFRTVRTAILFGARKEKAKTMLITSPASGDGKSTLVSNLAIAMAQAGQRTILLDADFRRPMQHTIFALNHDEGGLGDVLTGKMKLEQAIQATPVKRLSVLTCGAKVTNPSEVLNSHRFTTLLEHLAKVYDRVIIDAPPVTVVTDAQILGAICDVTVLVLRAHRSTRRIGQRAMESLQSVGAHLLGAVVNDVRRSGDSYGYYGRYGGSNGTGRSDERTAARSPSARRRGAERAVVELSSQRVKLRRPESLKESKGPIHVGRQRTCVRPLSPDESEMS
jgi:capsular exopolysaccharide synthesis family protein